MSIKFVRQIVKKVKKLISKKEIPKIRFASCQIIHRYSWVGPVGGFQTRIEKKNARIEFKKEKKERQLFLMGFISNKAQPRIC